ncbi:surface lipoprotein assembly modifier [Desulfovibrio litoralis]|uniref:Tetratricopeptide repeat-containing protein n=1 Tax=Desulfovibrio litoralis DSM 11393 TaxID=1121455 RepID=A0A1M7SKY1_9BACT|nr:surface lipoprotein assembly modifier [Desulfovibrio litoralis]SHN59133.1 Tetratricopeptide repeat-containing protein [Desulfovibrio litoralis DSM 11393]
MFKIILKNTLLCICLILLPVTVFADVTAFQEGGIEQTKAQAVTLLQQNKVAEAYELYKRLFRIAPDDEEISLGLARSAGLNKQPHQALMVYEQLLEKYPTDTALNLEIAQIYKSLGDEENAKIHFRIAAKQNSKKNAEQTAEEKSPFTIKGSLKTGFVYDTNANQGPNSNTVTLGNWNVDLDNAQHIPSAGGYFGANLDMGYPLKQGAHSWWLVGDLNYYTRLYKNTSLGKIDSRHWQWGRASTGIRYLDSQNFLDLRIKSEVVDYEFLKSILSFGPELTYLRAIKPNFHLITRADIEHRDNSSGRERNGTYGSAGQYARFLFGEKNHDLIIGAKYSGGKTEDATYSYDGWESMARFTFKLPYNFALSPSISYGEDYYHKPATALDKNKRQDEVIKAGLGLTYDINERWSVETSYQYTHNTSNSDIYRYRQHLTSVGISWSF